MENMKRGVKNIESKQSFQSLYEDFSKEESDKKDLMPMVNLLKAMTADADAKKLNADLDLIFVTFVKSNIHGSSGEKENVLKDFQSWVSIENVQSLNLNYKNNTGDVVQYIKQFAELEEEKKAETDNIVENTKEGVAQAKEQITEATAEDLISKLKVTERYQNFLSFELQKNAAVQIALKMLDQDLDLGNYGKKRDGVDGNLGGPNSKTRTAILAFQKQWNIAHPDQKVSKNPNGDGVVGKLTISALVASLEGKSTSPIGQNSTDVASSGFQTEFQTEKKGLIDKERSWVDEQQNKAEYQSPENDEEKKKFDEVLDSYKRGLDILDNKIENRTKEEIGEAIKTLKQEANDDWAGILKARDGTRVEQRPQAVDKNKQTLQDQIDANQKRINELNDLIDNHDATIQATIDGEQAKGRNITQKSIDEYKKRQESIKITRIRERDLLVVQNQKLQGSLQDPDLLRRDESHIQKYIAQVEVSKNSDQSSDDWVSQSNEGQEVIALRKTPKNNKQALKWMRNQKGGFTLEDSSLTNLTEAEKKEHLKQERKNLDNIYNATKKLDLPTVVSWLHAQPLLTSKQEWQNKIKTACPKERKHKGKIVDFAGFYFDFRQRGAATTLTHQLMQHLVQGASGGMNAVDIFNTKSEIDLVNKALDEQLEQAQEREQKSQEWFTPSEKALLGMLADTDANGVVNGVGEEKQKKNNRLDAGTVMGTQIISAYQSAKMQLGIEKGADVEDINKTLIKNLFSLLLTQKDKIYTSAGDFTYWLQKNDLALDEHGNVTLPGNIKSFDDVIDFFRRQPALLKIVKDTLNASNEYLTQAFMHGAKYAEDHLQREKDVFEEDQAVEGGSVGLAQADYQQYAEQHGEEIEKKYQIEAKIAPEYEKYLQNLDKQMEEKKTELKKQIEKENDPLKKSELQAQLKALNQPEFEESLKGLKDPIKRAEQIKKIRIDFVGALFQHYTFNDGTHSNSLGVGINVTFDRFNTRLGNNIKIFDKFSLSGGVGVAQYEKARSPIVGLAATLSNQVDLWKGGSLIYAAGAGVGYGLGGFSVGPFVAVGIDQQLVSGVKDGKIDAKSAHYLGVIANASLAGVGASAYWRRDKLEAVEAQAAEKIKPALSATIADITKLSSKESLTLDGILKALKTKFNKEEDSGTRSFAHDVYTALKPYENVLKGPDTPAKKRVIGQLADMMTLHRLNQNKEKLADSSAYLSSVALGVQLVSGWLPMPTGGLSFTKFKNLYYTDDQESFNRQKETLEKGYGADILDNLSFGQLATNLNITLKRRYNSSTETKEGENPPETPDFLEYDEVNKLVKINKKLMEKINLHILPGYKQFVAQDGEYLYVPAEIPVAFVNRIDSKKTDYHLILGSKGMGDTEFVSPKISFDPEKGFKTYDAENFAKDWVNVPTSVIDAGTTEMIDIRKEYLEVSRNRYQLEKRIFNACKNIPSITEVKIPADKIGDQNFTLQITFTGQVQYLGPVDYATLGKIQYKKSLNGTETLDFIAGQPVNGQIPKLEIATYTEEKESIVDQPIFPESLKDLVNKNVLEYFRDFEASDILINFRAKSKFFNDFYRYIEAGGDNNYKQAAKLFQTYLKTTTLKNNADLINAFDENAEKLAGSVNFIYATLSRVRKTQYKQFGSVDRTQPDWEAKQIDYMEQAKQKLWTEAQKIIDRTSVSAMEKSTLKSLVEQRILNDAQNFSDIAKILKTSINSGNRTPERQLYCILTDYKELAVSRDKSFANLIVNERDGATDNQGNEYFKRGSASYEELMNARNVVKDTLDFPFNNANERKGVGLVFAYGTDGQHHEKFVNSPLYVGNEKENLASLENVKTKEYFLRHLEKFQTSENVLTKTIEKIKMYVNDEKGLGANLDWLTPESLRACLLDPNKKLTFTSEKGTITIDLQADFKFGFFADCINETILMGPIKLIPTGDIQKYKSDGENLVNEHTISKGGVYTNATTTVVNAGVERKDFGIAAVVGKQKNPEQDKGNTKVKDETSETKVKDIDYEIDRGQVEVVDVDIDLPGGYHVTADREGNLWVTGPNLPTDGVLAVKTETGIVFTPPSIPNSGVSVDPIAPPATGSKGSHMDQTSNMVADVQVKNAVATKK